MIENAMVLAAGLGTRMRPITNTIPKPLVSVNGKTLLDHALDALDQGGVKRAAVNVHHFADQIEKHIETRQKPAVAISDERETLLDSGGGVKRAIEQIDHFGAEPFFILNADSFWLDSNQSNIATMEKKWDGDKMDMILLVATQKQAVGFDGKGDFFMDADGRLSRRGEASSAPYIYAGAIIAKTSHFNAVTDTKFSLNQLFDKAISKKRLYGYLLDGLWLHVGTPQSIVEAETAINSYQLRQSS